MPASWKHAVSKSGTFLFLHEGCSLKAREQGSPHNHHTVRSLAWQHGGSMLSLVKNTVIVQYFDAIE